MLSVQTQMLSRRIAGVELHVKCGRGLLQTPLTSVLGGWSEELHRQVRRLKASRVLVDKAGHHVFASVSTKLYTLAHLGSY